jgi:transposase-like protein
MDLSRAAYSRDLKMAAMRALDAGSATGEIARKYQLSPKLLERWRGEWRARGELAFPGSGRRGVDLPSRLISSTAATEMWDLRYVSHNRPVQCYTPTVVSAPAP